MTYSYTIQSATVATIIFAAFHKAGYKIDLLQNNDFETCANTFYNGYPNLSVNSREKRISGYTTHAIGKPVTLSQLFILLETKNKIVKLNDKYSAEVLPDGSVKVGCQTFPADAVKELVNAIGELD